MPEPDLGEIFVAFAEQFVGRTRQPTDIALPEMLRRDELDYSHESLDHVDAYLAVLHDRYGPRKGFLGIGARGLEITPELENTILWGGAYVGEVIRRAREDCAWVDYDDYVPEFPQLQPLIGPRRVATCAFLVKRAPEGGYGPMLMPMNKIGRYLQEGREHSTRYLARVGFSGD